MADTVKVPGLKNPQSKRQVAILGAGVVAVIGYALWKRHQSSAAAAATAASTAGDSTIDPATGYPYGSAEDANALSQQAAYYQSTTGIAAGQTGTTGTTVGTVISTNDQWTQAAENYLTTTVGLDPSVVSAALSLYITGEPVVQGSEADSIIAQAIAAEGQPPQAGANGYPPSIKHTSSGGTSGGKTQLPAPVLRFGANNRQTVTLEWAAVPGATAYQLQGNHGENSRVTGTSAQVTRGATGTEGHTGKSFWLIATSPNYYSSPQSNVVNV